MKIRNSLLTSWPYQPTPKQTAVFGAANKDSDLCFYGVALFLKGLTESLLLLLLVVYIIDNV